MKCMPARAAAAVVLICGLVHHAAGAGAGRAAVVYVSDADGQTVTVLRGDTLDPAHAAVGAVHSPVAIAVSPDRARVYTAGDAPDGSITVIDATTDERIGTYVLSAGGRIDDLAVSPDGSTIYASSTSTGAVLAFDTVTSQTTDTFPVHQFNDPPEPAAIDVSPSGDAVYVFSRNDSNVSKYATADGSELTNFFVAQETRELKVSPDGAVLVVAGRQAVQFLRTSDLQPVAGPTYVFIGPMVDVAVAGTRAYALNAAYQSPAVMMTKTGGPKSAAVDGVPSIDVYDLSDGTYVESIDLGAGPTVQGIAVTADGALAYVTRWDSGNIGAIFAVDLATGEIAGAGSTGANPRRVAVRPPLEPLGAYLLPKSVVHKKNATTPEKSVFKAAGDFDTGPGEVDLAAPATLTVGLVEFPLPAPTVSKSGRSFRFATDGLTFRVDTNRGGSSRAKFRLTYTGELGESVPTDGAVQLRFVNDDVDGTGEVLLEDGRFRLGKRPDTLSRPDLFVERAKAVVRGDGNDSFSIVLGLPSAGGAPTVAPDVSLQIGDEFDVTVPAQVFFRKKDSWTFKGDDEGIRRVTVDYRRERVTVVGKRLDLGTVPDGRGPLTILVRVGPDERGVAVRVVRGKGRVRY